jgi:hypothetical protein
VQSVLLTRNILVSIMRAEVTTLFGNGEEPSSQGSGSRASLNMLLSPGLTGDQIGNYRSIITAFLNVAETTIPGSPARV